MLWARRLEKARFGASKTVGDTSRHDVEENGRTMTRPQADRRSQKSD